MTVTEEYIPTISIIYEKFAELETSLLKLNQIYIIIFIISVLNGSLSYCNTNNAMFPKRKF